MWNTLRRTEAPAPVTADESAGTTNVTSVVPAIDALVPQFADRELVSGAEVIDLLLDLRLLAEADDMIASRV